MARSQNETRSLLSAALGAASGANASVYIRDVYPDSVIYDLVPRGGPGGNEGTYERPYQMTEAGAVTLGDPVQVMARTVYDPVVVSQFTMDEVAFSGDTVTWRGKVFETGTYPDKGFSLSTDEADAAIAAFAPVKADIEHRPSVLDGKLGGLTSLARKGADLIGTMEIPKALHDLISGGPLPVSMSWDRATKRPVGIGLVVNPRITDAKLVAAFSGVPEPRRGEGMNLLERIKALFKSATPEDLAAFTGEPEAVSEAAPAPQTSEFSALQAEVAKLKAEADAARSATEAANARRVEVEAAQFADTEITQGRAVPAERDAIAAMFGLCANADGGGVATFGADGTLNASDMLGGLRAMFAARPALTLTDGKIPSGARVVEAGNAPAPKAPVLDSAAEIYAKRAAAMNQ